MGISSSLARYNQRDMCRESNGGHKVEYSIESYPCSDQCSIEFFSCNDITVPYRQKFVLTEERIPAIAEEMLGVAFEHILGLPLALGSRIIT